MFTFKLLDNHHIELDCQFHRHEQKAELDVFVFLPPQLGIDIYTYPKELFYRNLVTEQCYVYGEADLEKLTEQIGKLQLMHGETKAYTHKAYWYQISLLSIQWKRALNSRIKTIQKLDDDVEIVHTLEDLTHLLELFRGNSPHQYQKKMLQSYRYLDEYLNLFVCQKVMFLVCALKSSKREQKEFIQEALFDFLKVEKEYAIEQGYRQYPATEEGAERLLTKTQQLQRYLDAPIRLKSNRKVEGAFTEQIIFGLAAAASMAIATAIAFYTQKLFGNFSTAFFYALVLSYILKDRFKEISRTIVLGYFNRRLYSFKYSIRDRESKKKVASIKDKCNFISHRELPENIKQVRNKQRPNLSGKDEKKILHYKRIAEVDSSLFPVGESKLSDQLVFNFSRIIRNLSDNKSLLYFYENNKTHQLIGRQRFHINIAVSVVKNSKQVLKYYHVPFNRKGIIDIKDIIENKKIGGNYD